ncbi:MAG TPA: hypothetical protein VMF52_04555 [Steroidobacteraceae bacterium]|nr:hypothetical protein [Steroidobacteraceae bacterium]
MKFSRLLPFALAAAGTAAHADVTVVSTTAGKAAFFDVGGTVTSQIKGNRMRTDSVLGSRGSALIVDIDGKRFIDIDDKKKAATVTMLETLRAQIDKVGVGTMTATLKKTSQTKTIAGYSCTVHDLNVQMPFSITGHPGDGMDVTMVMNGTACLSTSAPGLADYQAFYRASAESGFIFGDPKVAKSPAAAAQQKAYADLTRKMAEAGMALESHVTITASGSNPMASMMAKVAASDITTTVTQVTVGDLPADKFDVPAGYKVKTQK